MNIVGDVENILKILFLYIMATTSCEDYHKRLFREYKDK